VVSNNEVDGHGPDEALATNWSILFEIEKNKVTRFLEDNL